MNLSRTLILLSTSLAGALALAQPPAAIPPGGISPEWDIQVTLKTLAGQAARLKPILDQVKPQDWVAKGAPQTYVAQLQSTQNELKYLGWAVDKLAQRPERLTVALESLFRMEALERFLGSLCEGVRKYQNPALADLLLGVQNENWNNREKLRQYVVDLATNQEQEAQVLDQEAQRCRSFLSRQPAAPKTDPTKRTK